jgi:hypothetical protein
LRSSRPLARVIGRSFDASSITPSQTLLLARLVVVGLALILSQAILRWPVALVLGGDRTSLPIDAGIAAAALACVLVLLVWAYQTARPMVQAVTLRAIDAAIPTTGQALFAEPTRTSSVVGGSLSSGSESATIVAPLFARPSTDAPTVLAGLAADSRLEETVAVSRPDATVVARRLEETVAVSRPDATVVASRPDATVVASPPDATVAISLPDATVVARRPEEQDTVVTSGSDEPTVRVRDP